MWGPLCRGASLIRARFTKKKKKNGQTPPPHKKVGWDLEVGHVAQKVAVFRRKQMRPLRKFIDTAASVVDPDA